ncbi:MAG: hypothetical protein GX320_00185, partial [Tissierellia bacterium]|nr:hypothetical protein [Tissierellia bacterium]
KKDLVRVIGATFFIIIMIYGQLKIQSIAQKAIMEGDDFLLNLVSNSNFLVKKLGLAFPPSMWGALSLSSYFNLTGLAYLLISVGIGIISFLIMIFLSESLFFDGLIGNIEVSASKGKSKKRMSIKDATRVTKPYLALAKKELLILFKTPIYLMNAVGGVIIVPILMVMSITMGGDEEMAAMIKSFGARQDIIALVGIGFVVALAMLNSIGSTTFSREGKNFWIQRILPIKAEDQIIGRVLSALAIQAIGIIALLGSLIYLIRLEAITIVLISIFGILGSIAMTQIGMIIDIMRPMLTWDNPQKAMKQNLNVLFGMGVGILYLGGLGYLVIKIMGKVDIEFIFGLIAIVFSITSIILFALLKRLITRQFQFLE